MSSVSAHCPTFEAAARWGEDPFLKVFGGVGSYHVFSDLTLSPWDTETNSERIAAASGGTAIADAYCGALTFEWEALYAYHWGSEELSEFGLAINARWNDFPWNDAIATTFAVGTGPSYTTSEPEYERQDDGDISHWLNQFNLEMTLAAPDRPDLALLLRLQHRSSVFGVFDGMDGGSNFLTLGVRQQF